MTDPSDPPAPEPTPESQRRVRPWPGGFVRMSRGREVYVIERRVGGGLRKKIALDVRTEQEALVQLALFERDPIAFKTKRREIAESADQLATGDARIDSATVRAFLDDADARVESKELSKTYVSQTLEPYLTQWIAALGGRELRRVSLGELKAKLKDWDTARHKRVVALKAFTAWLREEDRLKRAEDPTLDLKTPSVKPARAVEDRAFTVEQVETFYAALQDHSFVPGWGDDAPKNAERTTISMQPVRDLFVLRALTGMHASEIDRLARGQGKIKVLPKGPIAGVLSFPHKRGSAHAVSVDKQALAAAQRLQDIGSSPNRVTCGRAVARVVAARPDLEGFTFEALRHSFATWARQGRLVMPPAGEGIPLEIVGQLMGHMSSRTTTAFYIGEHVPPLAVLPYRLRNEDDPPLPKQRR